MPSFHPELSRFRFLPTFNFGPRTASMARGLTARMRAPKVKGVSVETVVAPGPAGAPEIQLRIYRPENLAPNAAAMLWIHGGGFILGSPQQDEHSSAAYAKEMGMLVAAVRYRLAPQHPFPAPLEDCYAGLKWLHAEAAKLGIDRDRIAIGGGSAGGGLTAGLALLAHERKEVKLAFQLLIYPMIDDRTVTRAAAADGKLLRLWTPASNHYGWSSYLGREPGGDGVHSHAAPARHEDLRGLPPAWLGVGTNDLFHDEDVEYAKRLQAAGVKCDVTIVPGAFHGFDAVAPKSNVSREFREAQLVSMRRVLSAKPQP